MLLSALLAIVLLGLVGLAVDGGREYVGRRQMQNGADAAALAAVSALSANFTGGCAGSSDAEVQGIATDFVQMNAPADASPTTHVDYLDQDGAVMGGFSCNTRGVQVTATANLPSSFAVILGVRTLHPQAHAAALFGPAGGGIGTAPIAVDSSLSGDKTGLQPPNNGSGGSYVNAVVLNTAAFGSDQSLADAMANGVRDTITIGGSYPTSQPDGTNFSQSTINALQDRIHRGAARGDSPTSFTCDSPQLLILPTVGGGFPDPPAPVTINGFRAFFLKSVDPSGNFLRGVFVNAPLCTGTINPGGPCDSQSCVTVAKLIR